MATITLNRSAIPEEIWQAARWAFTWLLGQAAQECGSDLTTRSAFEQAIALDGLHLYLLEPSVAREARRTLLHVASLAAAGKGALVEVEGRVLDSASQEQFRVAAAELVKLLSAQEAAAVPR